LGSATALGLPDVTAPYVEPPQPPPAPLSFADESVPDASSEALALLSAPPKKKSGVGKWIVLIVLLGLGGAGYYGYTKKQPLELWAKVHDLSKGRFPNWPEFATPGEEAKESSEGSTPSAQQERDKPADAKPAAKPDEESESEAETTSDDQASRRQKDDEKTTQEKKAEKQDKETPRERERETSEKKEPDKSEKAKDDEAEPEGDLPPFDRGAAAQALGTIAGSVGSCKREDGPTGTGRATVTFASSGRATSATVSGAFAGTTVGGCVARLFRKARVPAFSGGAVTVAKRFSID
jgi:hypothetical protein